MQIQFIPVRKFPVKYVLSISSNLDELNHTEPDIDCEQLNISEKTITASHAGTAFDFAEIFSLSDLARSILSIGKLPSLPTNWCEPDFLL